MVAKPHRIRVRVLDGKQLGLKELNRLKSNQLKMPYIEFVNAKDNTEFIVCAQVAKHIDDLRSKLAAAGLEEVEGGDTNVVLSAPPNPAPPTIQPIHQAGPQHRSRKPPHDGFGTHRSTEQKRGTPSTLQDLRKKPYGFVALPERLKTDTPIWHDGTAPVELLSGEIRCQLETLTPLLVGWMRQSLTDPNEPYPVETRTVASGVQLDSFLQAAADSLYPDAKDCDDTVRTRKQAKVENERQRYKSRVHAHVVEVGLAGAGWSIDSKSVLCPLRAPWGSRPVVIPGDSLKGLLRHELGALLGAPMERVAERSYSYRPNAQFTSDPNRRLVARLARVLDGGVETRLLGIGGRPVRVPTRLELLPSNLRYDKRRKLVGDYYRFDDKDGAIYRGGMGAGERLHSRRNVHGKVTVAASTPTETAEVPEAATQGYLATLRHLVDGEAGHFSERHPDGKEVGQTARERIIYAASSVVFRPGDLVWVEWDSDTKRIVSFGWHYYYRWAYTDSVRYHSGNRERSGLFPLEEERSHDADGAPKGLSPVRRLLGYSENEGTRGVGEGDYAQVMGRVSINAALEVVTDGETDRERFLRPTFLKELGMPRPSAVEYYLQQPYHPRSRPSDKATLVTYGDAAAYDNPGTLAGRKFYLDRKDAHPPYGDAQSPPWEDDSETNRLNERSTLALEASQAGRRFRFTVRFRDLDPDELAAILVALCPNQFCGVLDGILAAGYCSKLGYARPLGWGSVDIKASELLLLDATGNRIALEAVPNVVEWVKKSYRRTEAQDKWLAVHQKFHPDADDYQRDKDRNGEPNIYTFHSNLRAEHSKARRCRGRQ